MKRSEKAGQMCPPYSCNRSGWASQAIIDILTLGSVNVSQVTNLSSLKETVPSVLFSLLNLSTVVLERQMFGMEMEWKIAPEAKDFDSEVLNLWLVITIITRERIFFSKFRHSFRALTLTGLHQVEWNVWANGG